jgi:CobQ-like glutamine amidotransferase family enzyme
MSRPIRVVHLYPRELGINGDAGNVAALVRRAGWRGARVEVLNHSPGDPLPESADLVHIGSGPVSGQRAVYSDVVRIGPWLRAQAGDGVPFLAIAAGWQLLGTGVTTEEGEALVGAGVFPSSATLSRHRTVGEIAVRAEGVTLAGFENHSATTRLTDGARPLGTVLAGTGNDPEAQSGERVEGVRDGALIGTALHGAFLPLNPVMADELLTIAAARTGVELEAVADDALGVADGYADEARATILSRLGVR